MINECLKIDDLYWNEDENKYVALSDEEIEKVITAAILDKDEMPKDISAEDVCSVVKWATMARTNHLLLQGVLAGRIKLNVSDDGETLFYEVEKNDEIQ